MNSKQSRDNLNRLQQIFKAGYWKRNLATGMRDWSDELYHIYNLPLGSAPPDMAGLAKYYSHADIERMSAMVQECMQEGTLTGDIFKAILDDGTIAWHFTSCEAINDIHGKLIAIQGVTLDITPFKALWGRDTIDTSTTFNSLVTNIDEIIFHADSTGHLILLNPAWTNTLGYNVTDSLGHNLTDYIIAEDLPLFITQSAALKNETRGYFNVECRLKRKDHTLAWVNIYVSAVKNSQDEIVGMAGRIMDVSRLRFYMDEMTNQQNFYELVINTGPLDIAVFNEKIKYVYINKRAIADDTLRHWLIGKNDTDYYTYRGKPVALGANRRKYLLEAIESRRQLTFEEKLENNGKDIYFLRTLQPMFNENGSLRYVIAYGINITTHKEQQLYNQKLNEAIEKATDGIAMTYPSGVFYYANPAFAGYFGFTDTDEMVGKRWEDMFDPLVYEHLIEEVTISLKENGSWSGSAAAKTRNGIPLHLEISLSLLPNNEFLYITRDITEKVSQQKELEKLALVVSKTNSFIAIYDSEAHIEWINEGLLKAFKVTLAEVIGKPMFDVTTGENTDKLTRQMVRDSISAGVKCNVELLLYASDNTPLWLLCDITPVKDEQGRVTNFVGVYSDITIIKKAEQALKDTLAEEKRLSDLKTKFTSLASHEFRTPLAGIQSSADIIKMMAHKKDVAMLDNISKHAIKIEKQIDKISEIMDNVFLMGRIESGRIKFNPESGSISSCINALIQEDLSKENTLYTNISVTDRGHPIDIAFDCVLMEHIINNLLSNAVKYSKGKPAPEVIVTYQADEVIIEVKDHGIGIPLADYADMFKSFFRAGNVEGTPGTGLGLVLVKQFVQMHGGTISFKSELNIGTSFFIHLPIKI